jgi:hypothetical protein
MKGQLMRDASTIQSKEDLPSSRWAGTNLERLSDSLVGALLVVLLLSAGDSLLNLVQVTHSQRLAGLTLAWESLKWMVLLGGFGFLLGPTLGLRSRKSRSETRRTETIDRLYRQLRDLRGRAETEPRLRPDIDVLFAELRSLQQQEADEMERRFESQLLLKPGEGWEALRRATDLLTRYEDSAPPHPSAAHRS